jgi:hypothetical protein
MKLFQLLLLFIISFICKAQIIPVENHFNYQNEIPDGTYIKDVNNVLDKFTGTWLGTYDNKNYEIEVEEVVYQSQIRTSLTYDQLYLRYKITDANGTVLLNTLPLPDDSDYVVMGEYVKPSGSYQLDYGGYEYDCGQSGTIFIKTFNNNTQMKLYLYLGESPYNEIDCPNGFAEQVFPTHTQIILTKQ